MGYKDGRTLKKYYCLDCGKLVSDYRITHCRNCADKQHSKRMKDKGNPSYKKGKPICIDCGKKLVSYSAKRCRKCYHNYIKLQKIMKGRLKPSKVKEKIKRTMILRRISVGKKNPMFGKVTHGKWGKYKGIYMRSSYEIAYAKYLDKNNIKWLYEHKTFDLGNTTYTPDFYLPKKNLYIEIKGYWRDDAKEKYKIFRLKYPKIKTEILMKEELEKLEVF